MHTRHYNENRLEGDKFSTCPVLERTGDGTPCGRCYFHLPDGKTCPRHGDIFEFPTAAQRAAGVAESLRKPPQPAKAAKPGLLRRIFT